MRKYVVCDVSAWNGSADVVDVSDVDDWLGSKVFVDIQSLAAVHANDCEGVARAVTHGKVSGLFVVLILLFEDVVKEKIE